MNPTLLNLVSKENKAKLLELTQISSLPDDQKDKALNDILEQILGNVLTRLSQALTEVDMQKIDQMAAEQQPNSEAIKYFLLTKVPNLDEIIKEEVASYQAK